MAETTAEREGFEGWCVLELMGHRRIAGFVSEATIAGGSFVRIDVPTQPAVTQFYSPGSIYAITPTTEELARRFTERARPEPVSEYDLPPRPRLHAGPDDGSSAGGARHRRRSRALRRASQPSHMARVIVLIVAARTAGVRARDSATSR